MNWRASIRVAVISSGHWRSWFSRNETFERAARLLRGLGAAETEPGISNNAATQFKGLFHLYLSGTEARPESRLKVLDEGLRSTNAKERELCLEALDAMLQTGHFSRGGGSEEIGSAAPLEDWQPKTYGDIRNFFRSAISRLKGLAPSADPLAAKAETILGRNIRGLLNQLPADEIKDFIDPIVQRDGFWAGGRPGNQRMALLDGDKGDAQIRQEVSQYFDALLPADPVNLAVMYCHGWYTDFHDPDLTYQKEERSGHRFDYPVRKSVDLAEIIQDPDRSCARSQGFRRRRRKV